MNWTADKTGKVMLIMMRVKDIALCHYILPGGVGSNNNDIVTARSGMRHIMHEMSLCEGILDVALLPYVNMMRQSFHYSTRLRFNE